MEKSKNPPSAEELLRRIQELEGLHTHIKQEISKLVPSSDRLKPDHQTASAHQLAIGKPHALRQVDRLIHNGVMESLGMKLTETKCSNIMLSMGQALHIFDMKYRICYWNRTAEEIYGFTPDEVYGKTPTEILVDPKDAILADYLLERTVSGESWSGEFPVTNNRGETFVVICTNTPFRDGSRKIIGGMCISSDSRPYQKIYPGLRVGPLTRFDVQQTSIASKISNLALKVKLKMKIDHEGWIDHSEDGIQSEANTPRGNFDSSPFGVSISTDSEECSTGKFTTSSGHKTENKLGFRKTLSSKANEWMAKKRNVWPWKGDDEIEVESLNAKLGYFGWQRLYTNQGHETDLPRKGYENGPQMCVEKLEDKLCENTSKNEASGLWLSSATLNTTSASSSSKSKAIIKVETETANVDYEILWEDLITKEQIGQGSCGTVYHGLWFGSDIAIKLFTYQEYSDNVMVSFKQEVSLMKRLRHPNILLFMGAVTSPQHLCIVTEFLPRGSLFRILQRNSNQLDSRRRLHMAMDIAQGMNYLNRCNPPIVHRDLKSSNLLVDKNWSVKVGDFGLSRIKHQTYLKTKSGKGTPQWMAPEVIRNEQADEKSDVYSFGVVLWEIITGKIPWDDLNPMQVIAAVGFMNRRLEIPKDVDPLWASLIDSCWCSEPQSRPTFQEILVMLKELQKKYAVERIRR